MTHQNPNLPFVTLSGELPLADFLACTGGVGLVRSEYLVRHVGESWASARTRQAVSEYLHTLQDRLADRPLWYRLGDFEARDVAMLADGPVPPRSREDNPIIGVRGLRRESLPGSDIGHEVSTLASLSKELPSLGLVLPFVCDEIEVAHWMRTLRDAGYHGPLGAMIEIPSAVARVEQILDTGVDHLLVGVNDLTGLMLGAARGTAMHDYCHAAVMDAVNRVWNAGRRRAVAVRVAGNFGPELPARLPGLTASAFSFHYQDWADFRPAEAAYARHERDLAVSLRRASDARLIGAGLLDKANAVTIAGMRRASAR